eukprot:scaffold12436_cov62-Phaeocystis_antarctica.AAC.3
MHTTCVAPRGARVQLDVEPVMTGPAGYRNVRRGAAETIPRVVVGARLDELQRQVCVSNDRSQVEQVLAVPVRGRYISASAHRGEHAVVPRTGAAVLDVSAEVLHPSKLRKLRGGRGAHRAHSLLSRLLVRVRGKRASRSRWRASAVALRFCAKACCCVRPASCTRASATVLRLSDSTRQISSCPLSVVRKERRLQFTHSSRPSALGSENSADST